jgi:hypothetical protein
MRAFGRGGCLAIGAIALLALPGVASAKPGYEIQPRRLTLEFKSHASHGYTVAVEAAGHRQVKLTASKGGFFATYTTSGRVSRDRIQADFGEFGRIGVRFRGRRLRTGESPLPHRKCHGREPVKEVGSFFGTIRFKGERGFAELDASRASGSLRQSFRRVCTRGLHFGNARPGLGKGREEEPVLTFLAVASKSAGRRVSFGAVSAEANAGERSAKERENFAIVVAKLDEKVGRVRVSRALLAFAKAGGVVVSQAGVVPVTATVALPKPFEGTADYREEPGTKPSWTGSLGVHLPGAGLVPLTGPDFGAVLCRVKGLKKDGCVREAESNLGESSAGSAQGRGSQSQAFWDARLSWSR